MHREEQDRARGSDAPQFAQPLELEVLVQVREDGDGVDQLERVIGVDERR